MRIRFITPILGLLIGALCVTSLTNTQAAIPNTMDVLYIGTDAEDWRDAPVLAALRLDDTFHITVCADNASISANLNDSVDVVVLQDRLINSINLIVMQAWVAAGHSIIIFCGGNLSQNPSLFEAFGVINSTSTLSVKAGYTNAVFQLNESKSSSITTGFDWNAVPDVKNYTILPYMDPSVQTSTLLYKESREDSDRIEPDPLILSLKYGSGSVVVFTPWVENGFSQAFWGCSFFNYLVYSTVITKGGQSTEKLSYASWEYSPVPHTRQQIYFLLLIVAAVLVGVVLVKKAKRNSKKAMDASSLLKGTGVESKPEEATGSTSEEIALKAAAKDVEDRQNTKKAQWDKVGMHKQISGFFTSLVTAILAAGPQIVLVLFIYPNFIMPFPSAAGVYSIVNDLFAAVWLVLDVGTSFALVTFFALHRIERPEKAVHYIQIFIFWQMITGIIQFTIVTLLGLFYFPNVVNYAYLSYHIMVHSMIQFPGFLSVMLLTLRALQRSDLEQISTVLVNFVFKIGVTYLCVLLFRFLYANSVMYGEIFGAIVGLNVGAWVGNFADFGFSYFLFRKAGYKGNIIFRWDFTKEEVIEVLKYGIRLVLGNVWVPAVATLQAILLTTWVSDYSSEMAYYSLALTIAQVVGLVGMFTDSLQSPIAESYAFKTEHGKPKYLERVYTTSFKWVNFLNFFLCSSLIVIGGRMIIGFSGPTWERSADFFTLIMIFQFLGPYSWIGDKFFLGTKKTTTIMIFWLVEQGVRSVLLLVMIPEFGMMGVMYAYIPALFTKDLLCIYFIRKQIVAPKWYWWQIWFVPLISGALNYFLLEFVANAVWQKDIFTSILLFFVAVVGFVNIFSLISGWLGGWDDNEIDELKLAYSIAPKGLNLYLAMIYYSVKAGKKIPSPFVGKSKIDLWESSQAEMDELQRMKKKLVL